MIHITTYQAATLMNASSAGDGLALANGVE
jgi:hypothetical protein